VPEPDPDPEPVPAAATATPLEAIKIVCAAFVAKLLLATTALEVILAV